MSLGAFGDSGCVFAHADVAPVVRAIFDTIPMSANGFDQFGCAVVGCGCARHIVGVFLLFLVNVPSPQIVPFAVNEDELPASDQTGLFGAEAFTLDAPALHSPAKLVPSSVILTGKKIPAVASVLLAQGSRFGCL